MLTTRAVSLYKSQKPLLKEISLGFPKGSITLLLGQSGAGKSTLLRCIAHLETNYGGAIAYEGQDIRQLSPQKRAATLSFIAQSYALFPHLTALHNCSQPLSVVNGLCNAQAQKNSFKVLESLNMQSYASAYPHELSGGQQQRVAIARALALNPHVLLLDEPSSALDPENSCLLAEILKKLANEGKTIVIATQDMLFKEQLVSSRCFYLEKGKLAQ